MQFFTETATSGCSVVQTWVHLFKGIVYLWGQVLPRQEGAVYLFKRFDWTSKAGHMEEC